jgi:hypothetical protein
MVVISTIFLLIYLESIILIIKKQIELISRDEKRVTAKN